MLRLCLKRRMLGMTGFLTAANHHNPDNYLGNAQLIG